MPRRSSHPFDLLVDRFAQLFAERISAALPRTACAANFAAVSSTCAATTQVARTGQRVRDLGSYVRTISESRKKSKTRPWQNGPRRTQHRRRGQWQCGTICSGTELLWALPNWAADGA